MIDVFIGIKSAIGDKVGVIIKVQTFFNSPDRLDDGLLIRRVSRMRLDENGYAMLVGYHG